MIQSKKIDRYNDDFYLDYTGTNKIYGDFIATEISYNLDWSISWFDIFPSGNGASSTRSYILDTRATTTANFGIGIYSSYDSVTQSNRLNIVFRTSSSSNVETFNTSTYLLNTNTTISNFVVTFNSSTRLCSAYRNLELIGTFTNNINFESTVPSFSLGASRNGNNSRIGGIRDFTTYDKQLSKDEISYIYKTGVPPVSAYSNIQHYYPLNEIPTETGGNYFMSDKAESFNSSATNSEVELIGWTGTELGIPTNTTATTYRDFYTKANYIPDVGYKLGLNFDSSKQQYLEVTGLEAFDKDDGYTFLIGVKKEVDTGQQSIFSCVGDEGFSRFYDIFRRGAGFDNEFRFVSPVTLGSPTQSSNVFTGIDPTRKNFLSYFIGDNQMYNPYSTIRIRRIIDVNEQQDYQTGVASPNLGYGFNEITNPIFNIGARLSNSLYLNGKITFFTIIKGVITKEQEKTIFNNNIYRSPYEVLQDTSKIILDVDFQNPFVDGTDIKFPDNSGNCEVIAKQNSGTDWSTLVGVQNSID